MQPPGTSKDSRMKKLLIALALMLVVTQASAQKMPWEEYDKQIQARGAITAHGPQLFGDEVELSSGALSFSATDISVPGNNGLPVALTRTLSIIDRDQRLYDMPMGDWDLDIPRLEGVFAPSWQDNRCTGSGLPPTVNVGTSSYSYIDYWQGNHARMPGGGELLKADQPTVPKPTTGGPYPWVTAGMTYFSCLPNLVNGGPGEGFLAITTDGTKYWFNHMARFAEPGLASPLTYTPEAAGISRARNALYVTRIEDRHGNWVTYNYSNAYHQPVKPTSIQSSDGRSITLTYSGSRVATASNGTRTWTYSYTNNTLSQVLLPDSSKWTINFQALSGAIIDYSSDDGPNFCGKPGHVLGGGGVGTIVHPSGAVGEFEVMPQRFGRTNTPRFCINWTVNQNGSTEPGREIAVVPNQWFSMSLGRKKIYGPGMPTSEWIYRYSSGWSWIDNESTKCDTEDCMVPVCVSDACAGGTTVVVTGPAGEYKRYKFGNSYHYNEGKLLSVETGSGPANQLVYANGQLAEVSAGTGTPTFLRSDTTGYALATGGQFYPAYRVGTSLQARGANFTGEYPRPQVSKVTSLDGATFSAIVTGFDEYQRPISVVRSSSLGYSRTDATTYLDNQVKWVLGLPTSTRSTGTDPGLSLERTVVNEQTEYDPVSLLPVRFYGPGTPDVPGLLLQTLTYDASGVVSTVKDGNNNLITLSSWYRGVPRNILYADATSESADVTPEGWITSITNEVGYTSTYDYDAMGRLARITHPTGDSTVWNDTTQVFEQVNAVEYGIPAGHWRQTIATGNGRKVTYYDAMWRPIVVHEYDVADVQSTERFQRYAYDDSGRMIFASYPASIPNPTTGTWTEYDELGRVTSVSNDSEFAEPIVTLTEYLPGFQTRVTNGRLKPTTTDYMAWDQPSTDLPVAITHPEGAFTDIQRDMLGKPKALLRRNAAGSTQVTRSYVYDDHQRLCKSVEPETGATLTAYDLAGNVAWTKSGAALPDLTSCDTAAVAQADRTTRSYDARNRVLSLNFPDGRGNTTYDYTADGLLEQVTVVNGGTGGTVVTGYAYNRRRLPTGEVAIVGTKQWPTGYGYDANGFLASHVLPGGLSIAYQPNALGQATQAGTFATGASYFPNGALKQFTYGNGIVHTLTQNARGLPERSRDAYGSVAVHDDTMDYDFNGNVAAITDGLSEGRGDREMTYDDLDRLTATISPMFGTASYTYDVLDNLKVVQVTGGPKARSRTYVYDTTNRLRTTVNNAGGGTADAIEYDVQGNVSNKSGTAYDFDFGNRLRSVAGTANEHYAYDGHGRRVLATRNGASIYSVYGQDGVLRFQSDERVGKSTQYVHLAGSLVAQVEDPIPLTTPALTVPGFSGNGSYTVSWTAAPVATRYQLEEQVNSGAWATIHDAAGLSKVFNDKPAASYGYRVRACSATACGSVSPASVVEVQLPPTVAPTLSAPATGLNGTFTVNWTSVAAATRYQLEERQGAGAWATILDGPGSSQAISGKAAGDWSYQVRGCNAVDCGPVSAIASVNVVLAPTATPTLTAPASNYTGSYSLSWTAVATAVRYELEERLDAGAWSNVHNAAATTKAVAGRTAGSWSYRVRGCNDAGCAPYSAVQATLVTLAPTAAPTVTAPATNYSGSYPVSWTSVAAATTYAVEQQANGGAWTELQNVAASSLAVSGQDSGSYGYRARGCNAGGCGPYSAVGTTQVTLPPASAPSPTAPASNSTGDFTVSWNAVAEATSYQIDEQINGGAWAALPIYPANAISKALAGKTPGTYGYRVRACNIGGCSGSSATVSVSVTLSLTSPSLTGDTSGSADYPHSLSWTSVPGAVSYELQQSYNSGSFGTVYNGPLTTASYQRRGGTYRYRVRACASGSCSAYSATHTVNVANSTNLVAPPPSEDM